METLAVVVEVRCLACGTTYVKPEGRGTVRTNPGCPACGYLGWSPGAGGVNVWGATGHSAVGRPRRRAGRSR